VRTARRCFRNVPALLRFKPQDGMRCRARAHEVSEARGEYS
jgi:hypothetical protein